jgi:hypothetical protein
MVNKKKLISVVIGLILFGCNQKEAKEEKNNTLDFSDITKNLAGSKEAREARYSFLKSNVVIILAEELKGDSTHIKVQDFVDDKGSFIPVFTSKENYKVSSQGNELGKGITEISAMFLLYIMNDEDRIRLNPGLKDESYFEVKDLKEKFKAEMAAIKTMLSKSN